MIYTNGQIFSGGEEREYLLHVPAEVNRSNKVPLVITIHGFAQWPANLAMVSHWNRLAEENGFIVVYPSGTGFPKRWQIVQDPSNPGSVEKEVQFFRDLIAKLSLEYPVDSKQIYMNGLSNGGGMSLRLACAMPEQVAAIGGVAGAYLVKLEECTGKVPAIFFHGRMDKVVPFEGGPSEYFDIPFPNIVDFVKNYAQQIGCSPEEQVILERGAVRGVRYTGSQPREEVVFYSIADGGHTWPGGKPLPVALTGKTSQEIDATRLMWEFFVQYSQNR